MVAGFGLDRHKHHLLLCPATILDTEQSVGVVYYKLQALTFVVNCQIKYSFVE